MQAPPDDLHSAVASEPVNVEHVTNLVAGANLTVARHFQRRLHSVPSELYGIGTERGRIGELAFVSKALGGEPATPLQIALLRQSADLVRVLLRAGVPTDDPVTQRITYQIGWQEQLTALKIRSDLENRVKHQEQRIERLHQELSAEKRTNEKLNTTVDFLRQREKQLETEWLLCRAELRDITGSYEASRAHRQHWVVRSCGDTPPLVSIEPVGTPETPLDTPPTSRPQSVAEPRSASPGPHHHHGPHTPTPPGSTVAPPTAVSQCMQPPAAHIKTLSHLQKHVNRARMADLNNLLHTVELLDRVREGVKVWVQGPQSPNQTHRHTYHHPTHGTATPTPHSSAFSSLPKGILNDAADRLFVDLPKECHLAVHTALEFDKIHPKSKADSEGIQELAAELEKLHPSQLPSHTPTENSLTSKPESCSGAGSSTTMDLGITPTPGPTPTPSPSLRSTSDAGVSTLATALNDVNGMIAVNKLSVARPTEAARGIVSLLQRVHHLPSLSAELADLYRRADTLREEIQSMKEARVHHEVQDDVVKVEEALQRQLKLEQELYQVVGMKLAKTAEREQLLREVSDTQADHESALFVARKEQRYYRNLCGHCDQDLKAVEARLVEAKAQRAGEKQKDSEIHELFLQKLKANTEAHTTTWGTIITALDELMQLKAARVDLIRDRLDSALTDHRLGALRDLFEATAGEHTARLVRLAGHSKVMADANEQLGDALEEEHKTINGWFQSSLTTCHQTQLTLHKEYFDAFRSWYLQHGEYTHKKQLLLRDIDRKVEDEQAALHRAMERLDDEASGHRQALRTLQAQRDRLKDALIPKLLGESEAALPHFDGDGCTRAFFEDNHVPFTHPVRELQILNEQREVKIRMQELQQSQDQMLHLQEALLGRQQYVPDDERRVVGFKHARIHQRQSALERSTSPAAVLKEREKNAQFKQVIQDELGVIPARFLDPLTSELIVEPVAAADGQVYDRESIQRWLDRRGGVSPMDGTALSNMDLEPRPELKGEIDSWKRRQVDRLRQAQGMVWPDL